MPSECAYEVTAYHFSVQPREMETMVVIAYEFDEAMKKAKDFCQVNGYTLFGVKQIGVVI